MPGRPFDTIVKMLKSSIRFHRSDLVVRMTSSALANISDTRRGLSWGGVGDTQHRKKCRVAVVGAGASGLAAIKALKAVGLQPEAFEASHSLGGVWAKGNETDGPTYRSLRTNTSKQVTAFSDMPFPDSAPNFPARDVVEHYLLDYARAFGLMDSIHFNCRVTAIARDSSGQWRVRVNGSPEVCFDAVVVCTGVFHRPTIPAVSGNSTFAGQVLHSTHYSHPEAVLGDRVVVVGLGSSAVDIAVDLVSIGKQVTMCVRRGAWLVPREMHGRPRDHTSTRLLWRLPPYIRTPLQQSALRREYENRHLPPLDELWSRRHVPFDARNAPSVTTDHLHALLASGVVDARPAPMRLDRRIARFADGSSTPADAIIFCTGYDLDMPFIGPHAVPWAVPGSGLYRLVFPPHCPSLAFIGVCRVQGAVLPLVELQSRWVAHVLAGDAELPSADQMHQEIALRREAAAARRDLPFRVPFLPYLDQIGDELGATPGLLNHPSLARELLLGPPIAAHFRLQGPDVWDGAKAYIRQARHW